MNAYAKIKAYMPSPKPKDDERTTPVPTDEERARVRAKLAAFRLQNAAFTRGPDKPVHEPLSAEKRAEYAAMLKLPDRSGLTAEEQQFRNRIKTQVEAAE